MEYVGIFYGHLVYFRYSHLVFLRPIGCGYLVYVMAVWYIFPVLVCCTNKNLATLVGGWIDVAISLN
jgi:hypothetical protein